jgi:glycosyltransferase involved in cell wall biosynthesis
MVFLARADRFADPDPDPAPVRPRRILYAVGPGDVVRQYRELLDGREPPFQMTMAFSEQFLDGLDGSGAVAHLISSHPRRDSLPVGRHRVENRPRTSLYYGRGLRHHLGAALYGLAIVAQALRRRATIVIADSGTTHWIVLSLLSLFRIPVIAVLHNALWPMGFPPRRRIDRLLRWLDGWFFRHVAAATVCVSPECERQVRQAAGTPKGPIYQCRAQYREGFLSRVEPPDPSLRPFRVLFMGRMEEFKGVFLILSVAELLENELPGRFQWRIVGSGPDSEALLRQIEERNLSQVVEAQGMLPDEQKALKTLGWAHAMVVPTTAQFIEGLAMTAAESVLAGRPVVVSSVVPAWEILGLAAIRAEAGNPDSFADAFRRLALDAEYYAECRRATEAVQAQFYDRSQGLGAVLARAIAALR